jgi:putative membrane protein
MLAGVSTTEVSSDRRFVAFATAAAAAVAGFLLWLVYFRAPESHGHVDLSFLRPLNAFWNGAAGVFVLAGFVAIRSKKPVVHRYLMITALTCSAFFLVGYLSFTILDGTRITYTGAYRPLYLGILITHTILATTVPLFATVVVYFAVKKKFATHKKIARVAFPIWLYVSVTGVVIYEMLAAAGA